MKVICKKNYIENNIVLFKKNNFYDIGMIGKEYVWVYLDNNKDIYKFFKEHYRPYMKHFSDTIFFEDYFQTLKEERQKKLKKINESNL